MRGRRLSQRVSRVHGKIVGHKVSRSERDKVCRGATDSTSHGLTAMVGRQESVTLAPRRSAPAGAGPLRANWPAPGVPDRGNRTQWEFMGHNGSENFYPGRERARTRTRTRRIRFRCGRARHRQSWCSRSRSVQVTAPFRSSVKPRPLCCGLERFQKYCSRSAGGKERAVFLGFGFVSAQSQGSFKPAPSPKPRQNPKILAPNGCSFSSNAQELRKRPPAPRVDNLAATVSIGFQRMKETSRTYK